MIKMKGYLNNFYNNKTDILAKQENSSNLLFSLKLDNMLLPSTFTIAWNHRIIEQSIRSFAKDLTTLIS